MSVASSPSWPSSSSLPDIRNFKWTVTYEYSTGTLRTRRCRVCTRYRLDFRQSPYTFPPPAFTLWNPISRTRRISSRIAILHEEKRIDARLHLSLSPTTVHQQIVTCSLTRKMIFSRGLLSKKKRKEKEKQRGGKEERIVKSSLSNEQKYIVWMQSRYTCH